MTEQINHSPLFSQTWPAETAPTVSVLVPTYNHERFLGQCLASILQQRTDFPVEIIVHDDASTDSTRAIIEAYAQKFPNIIKPIFQSENQHAQHRKIRPIMLAQARGQFIASCDGDDLWIDHRKITKQLACLLNHPQHVLSFHNAIRIDETNNVVLNKYELPVRAQRNYRREELRVLQWGWMFFGTVMHRNVKVDIPPEYHLIPNSDIFFPMLLAAFGGAIFQSDVGPLAYRQHQSGMWSLKSADEKSSMHIQTCLQITNYFVRIKEFENAQKIITGRLSRELVNFFQKTDSDRQV